VFGTVVIHEGGVSPVWLFVAAGAVVLIAFFLHVARWERSGRQPLLSIGLFRSRVSNLGLVTQNIQWLVMQGSFFVISVFLQQVRHYNAIETGLILTPATIGILGSSSLAGRMARRRPQRTLIAFGFVLTIAGLGLLLAFARATSPVISFAPDLFLMGLGIGVMLTASVNVVQSAFPEEQQGEISGLSRSVSNLGSSLGTALAGSFLVSSLVQGNKHFAFALASLTVVAVVGLVAALLLPRQPVAAATTDVTTPAAGDRG
jgi:MFS family permease